MTRKTSSTNNAIATSLRAVAIAASVQSWFAAQKKKAKATMTAFAHSANEARLVT
jgi:hypothetical protein